jgi:hypothetical protein
MRQWQMIPVVGVACQMLARVGSAAESARPAGEAVASGGIARLLYGLVVEQAQFVYASAIAPETAPGITVTVLVVAVLCAVYGAAMGWSAGWRQATASAMKVPMLLLLTLGVCFPAIVVSTLLCGIRLEVMQILRLFVLVLALHAVILVSAAPIIAFFGIGSDYHFLKLLNVGLFAASGLFSMIVLRAATVQVAWVASRSGAAASNLFLGWVVLYGFVGCQMAWLLRPFIGSPGLPFEFLRRKTGGLSFYSAVVVSVAELLHRNRFVPEHAGSTDRSGDTDPAAAGENA